jgi:alpha,alpha-trehalase
MSIDTFELRPSAYPVEPVDPLSLAPDPGEMAEIYVTARQSPEYPQGFPDGMSMACSTPLIPYAEMKARYVRERNEPGFDPRTFWERYNRVPSFDQSHIVAPDGMPIDDYILQARPYFIKHAVEAGSEPNPVSGFDFDLPFDMSTAGGRFGLHMFPHDIHQIMKGYASAGRWGMVINSVDNLEYMINMLGWAPNGNSGIYATRFQIPYFSRGVRMLYEHYGEDALIRYLPTLEREYDCLMRGRQGLSDVQSDVAVASEAVVRMPDGSYLNRYWDSGHGPRLESYREDVELGRLVLSREADIDTNIENQAKHEVDFPKVMQGIYESLAARAESGEEFDLEYEAKRLARLYKFHKDMRGGAASGWDYTSRWMKDGKNIETIATSDIIPVDLNSLMLGSEELLSEAWGIVARRESLAGRDPMPAMLRSLEFRDAVTNRGAAMNKYQLDRNTLTMGDFDFVKGKLTGVESSAMAYPMYAGMTDRDQTLATVRKLRGEFLLPGGIICTLTETGEQWDGDRAWASPNWAAARGAARRAHELFTEGKITEAEFEEIMCFAEEVRDNFMHGVEVQFNANGIFVEKVWARDPKQIAAGGEYKPVLILNMTMETYAAMKEWNPRDPGAHRSLGSLAVLHD